jgi:predicted extracellular nuclease
MDYNFSKYRIQPTAAADYEAVNARTPAPDVDEVPGSLKVASFNVLNYFTTIDTGAFICSPSGTMECRGADTAEELTRQRDKILAAAGD